MNKTVRTVGRIEHVLLGRELRRLREKAGLSLRQMAALIDKHHSYVVRVESGDRTIDIATMIDFIQFTGGSPPEVLQKIIDEAKEQPRPSNE